MVNSVCHDVTCCTGLVATRQSNRQKANSLVLDTGCRRHVQIAISLHAGVSQGSLCGRSGSEVPKGEVIDPRKCESSWPVAQSIDS